jgi:hypothetical protein
MEKSKTKIFRASKKRSPKVKEHEENGSEDTYTYTNLKLEEEQDNDSESWSIESLDEKENAFLKQYSESEDFEDIADSGSNNESESDDYIAGDSLDENDLDSGENIEKVFGKTLPESEYILF